MFTSGHKSVGTLQIVVVFVVLLLLILRWQYSLVQFVEDVP